MRLLTILLLFVFVDTGMATVEHDTKVAESLPEYKEYVIDKLTVYNPVAGQTDSSPLITASGRRIDTVRLKYGKVRWLAVSRDFLKRWGGDLHYGDTVEIIADDPEIDGEWVIQDNMNKRYKKSADLLFYKRNKGLWKAVRMRKRL